MSSDLRLSHFLGPWPSPLRHVYIRAFTFVFLGPFPSPWPSCRSVSRPRLDVKPFYVFLISRGLAFLGIVDQFQAFLGIVDQFH